MINNRLEWWLESENVLLHQFDFRKNRGTLDALTKLVSDIQIAFTHKLIVGSMFLDITNGYTNID